MQKVPMVSGKGSEYGQHYRYTSETGLTVLLLDKNIKCMRGDQKIRGKVLLNHIAYIDCKENS